MNRRGQAALEYLMTYGWALIVIAIVVGVLVFLVSAPTSGVSCSSNDPTAMNVVSNNIDQSTGKGSLVVTNTSGAEMSNLVKFETGVFSGATYTVDTTDSGNVDSLAVGDHTITISAVASTGTQGKFNFDYTDAAGLAQDVNITCQNLSV